MATDQFGNILSPEEEERLRQHQLRMKALPGLPGGVAVDTFSDIPTSLPAYGPAAGLGPSSYMGAPQGMPTYNQSPSLAAPSLLVDAGMAPVVELAGPTVNKFTPLGSDYTPQQLYTPVEELQQQNIPQNVIPITPTDTTLAGMATVPFTGMESSFGAGTKVAAGPGWGFNVSPTDKSVGVTWGTTPNAQLPSDQTGGISWPEKPTVQESVPMGIYEDLLSKKTLYDMGPGHPTVIKELVKTLEDQRNVVVDPGPTEQEVEAIIEKAISAPTGNLERIAIAKAANKRAQDLARQKQAAANKRAAARQAQAAQAAQEATRRSLEKQMRNWQGRDRQDESAMAQIQAALDHIADLQGTGVTSVSPGDRSGEVREAMRSVGYGGPEWT